MALASNTPAAEIRPAAIANTSTSLDEAISGLPKTLVSMGNQGLAAFPSSTISTIGLLTPSGAMDVQWEPSELSETFDWPEYLANISGDAEEIAKLNAELAKRQGREPIEILGVYDSVVKSNRGRKPKSVVVLARSGNEIRGKSIPDSGDRITGTLQNNKIQFRWTFADSTYDRMGTLKIKDSRNDRLEGTWANTGFPPGTWKLSKTGPGEATDIDGLTFTASKE
jgi:hypothetical protein